LLSSQQGFCDVTLATPGSVGHVFGSEQLENYMAIISNPSGQFTDSGTGGGTVIDAATGTGGGANGFLQHFNTSNGVVPLIGPPATLSMAALATAG
jgi:hypothetical protein